MSDPDPTSAWWLEPAPAATQGLSRSEAQERLAHHGPNTLESSHQRPLALQFLARFRNPLVLVLLAASAVSAATGDAANFFIIMALVLLSVTLDFVQEHRADRAAQKLRESVALRATVIRDGRQQELPVSALVPGDVVLLAAGERIPADGRLIEARDFFVNQALLTGESYPVEKRPGELDRGATELQQAANAVFMGSSVVSGSARVRIMATGAATALGEVAHSIQSEPPATAFEVGMHRFAMLLVRVTLWMVLFVMLVTSCCTGRCSNPSCSPSRWRWA
ncbi:HAD-IC family P-type ATPase [Variovorax sp. YR216]|uniref:HAD-IC family P-type ATPase n=1 Tax=Variovorax sp. YR216 TaxID=1882828 RepID=UPI0008984C17|nr:HAD-IC family P-type ATPase [Variovorax sp. YR216]SEA55208.1 Mg2+-importing ATPase [Variovorax sp. YR216]